MYSLTCRLAAGRFVAAPSIPQIGHTSPDIGTAVVQTEANPDTPLARTGLTDLLQFRSAINLILGVRPSDAHQCVILMALAFRANCTRRM